MATATKTTAAATPTGEYLLAPITDVVTEHGFNNRRELGDIDELTNSIQSVGLLEPLIVRRGIAAKTKGEAFYVIAGHRRLAAAQQAGLMFVPVIVVDLDEKSRLEALLVENLHRKDIDPLEEADGYRRLIAFGLSQGEIAAKVGRSQAHVSKRIALLGLVPDAVEFVVSGGIPLDKAIELAKIAPELQADILEREQKETMPGDQLFEYTSPAHVAKQITEERELAQRKKDSAAKAKKEGVQLLKGQINDYSWYSRTERPLGNGPDQVKVGLKEHRGLKCHRAYIDRLGHLKYVCADPASHMSKKDAEKFKERHERTSYKQREEQRKARAAELAAIKVDREKVVTEALAKLDPTAARRFALESFLIQKAGHGYERQGPGALLALLGEDASAKNQLKRLYEYCNKSEANLLRASVALSYVLGIEALDRDQTYDQHGVAYVGTFDWLKSIGYQPSELEVAFGERVKGDREDDGDSLELAECRICGCTDEQPCEGGCSWVEDPLTDPSDGDGELCSRCVGQATLEARLNDEGPLAGDITDEEAAEYLGLTTEDARKVLEAPANKAMNVYKDLLGQQEVAVVEDVVTDGRSTPIESESDGDSAAPAGQPVDQRKCTKCGCHEDCAEGCVWVAFLDDGPQCSKCYREPAAVVAKPEKPGPVDQRARRS